MATDWLRGRARSICSFKFLKCRIPIIDWLPRYTVDDGVCDLIAGVTVGLTVIPQGIAYALLAGLPAQYGLYSAFMGCFLYVLFGTSKDITIGPTAIMSLMTHEYVSDHGPDYAVLICFLAGCIELFAGVLNLGFLINFISIPVIAGFTSAAAITIATSQVEPLFGLDFKSEGFVDTWVEVFKHIKEATLADSLMGVISCIVLLLMRKMKDLKIGTAEDSPTPYKIIGKIIWLTSTARNAIVVIICAVIAYGIQEDGSDSKPFKLTGEIDEGLPGFSVPPFHTNGTENGTSIDIPFTDMVSDLGIAIFIIPLLGILENVAIAKAFSAGKPVDATQEMIALGICNIAGSFVSSMPTTGSFSRTAVNSASGVRTTLGGIYTGILVVLALEFLTPYFFYIPKSALGAVIITAVIFTVEVHIIKPIWRSRRWDL